MIPPKQGFWELYKMQYFNSKHIIPKKSLGQNFLINRGVLNKIVEVAEISKEDVVLEVGPGTGNLTEKLAERAFWVVAIEKDSRLIEPLKEKFKDSNVEIVEGNILKIDIGVLLDHSILLSKASGNVKYKVVANIPYYITSNLLRTIFEKWPRPKLIVLTVQKEVAQRIVAKPPDMNLLALSVQFYAEPKIIGYISRGSFRPMPNVDSAIIKLKPRVFEVEPPMEVQPRKLFRLIKAGFSEKRKQLVNNLAKNFGIMREDMLKIFEKVGIEPNIRTENLSLSQWIELSKFIEK